MGFYQHPRVFGPLDLEIIDLVYEVAWARLEARDPLRNIASDDARHDALRKLIMDCTGTDRIEFDTLYERVLARIPEEWPVFTSPSAAA
jgi:hypothetical protein